jgi:hypothetical protein
MRFSCHVICEGRFYPAGVEIPPDVAVPGGARQYAVLDVPQPLVVLAEYNNSMLHKPLGRYVPAENMPKGTSHPSLFSS